MLRKILIAAVLFALPASAAELTPEDLRPRPWIQQSPMPGEQRLQLLGMLEQYGGKYLAELETVSFKSFEGVTASGPVVAALVTEAEDVKVLMREFIAQVKALRKNPQNSQGWLLLVRNFYIVEQYMADLERFKVMKSTDYVGVRMLMPAVLDRILLPGAGQG